MKETNNKKHIKSNAYNDSFIEMVNEKVTTTFSELANVTLEDTNQKCWYGVAPVAVGESANNNGNASCRNVNGNNAVSNTNDNWAPRFALKNSNNNISEKPIRHVQQGQILHEKTTDCTFNDVMELLQCEYDEVYDNLMMESNAERRVSSIWQELKKVNHKRHLKGLKKFIVNREIVEYSVDQCLSHASKSPQRNKALKQRDKIVDRIIEELTNETYVVGKCTKRIIKKRGKDGKNRNAHIFPIYDRCVQNVIYTVIKEKCVNKLLRNVYSGIQGRSTTSNDKRYCLFTRVHDFCCKHPNAWIGLTDIKHFYETLKSEIVCQVFYEFVKDRYVFKLIYDTMMSLPTLPIGGTLSQIAAMLTINECDREVLRIFKPKFYAIFGDNRLFGDEDKQKLVKIKEYQDIYYETRFGLQLKEDYSYHKVADGFRFCKTDFNSTHTHIRSELKRRAIRGQIKGQQHYAGYKGFLMKTDSKRLRNLIETPLDFKLLQKRIYYNNNIINDINNMEENKNKLSPLTYVTGKLPGEKKKLDEFINKHIIIGKFTKVKSKQKDGNDYYKFQIFLPVKKDNKNTFLTYITWNSSADITYFFDRIVEGKIEKPKNGLVTVRKEEQSFYFEGYRDFNNDRGIEEIEQMDLDIDTSIFEENGDFINK